MSNNLLDIKKPLYFYRGLNNFIYRDINYMLHINNIKKLVFKIFIGSFT